MMPGGRIGRLLLGIALSALSFAGCGGGGGGGSTKPAQPPLPPWTLNIYQSPGGEKLAEGTLTNPAEAQYVVNLAGKAYPLSQKDIALASGKATLPLADQKESFAAGEFSREMGKLAQGKAAQLHSLVTDRVYVFEPEK